MTRHVVALVGDLDPYRASGRIGTTKPIELRFNSASRGRLYEDSLWQELSRKSLVPPQIAVDFYRMAATAFSADLRVWRSGGFDGWQRHFVLHLPVADPALWNAVTPHLKQALGFLSGDTWDFVFRSRSVGGAVKNSRHKTAHRTVDKVCLLSGGLDSFVGAADEITDGNDLICVSHNAAGTSAFSSPAQDRVMELLRNIRGPEAVSHVKASVSPPTSISAESESTQRSRSIMFVALGVLVSTAASVRERRPVPLVIPENGFISLNVPLTSGRVGSLSTRTTHPYFIERLKSLLRALGMPIDVQTPFRFMTKGQMLLTTSNPAAIRSGAGETVSCAHPSVKRFNVSKKNHCGYCVPCIIRRASMRAAGLDNANHYTFDVALNPGGLSSGQARDLRAFQMALLNQREQSSRAAILSVAPLPGGADAIMKSIAVYEDGLREVYLLLSNE